jgi:hypothetical protein
VAALERVGDGLFPKSPMAALERLGDGLFPSETGGEVLSGVICPQKWPQIVFAAHIHAQVPWSSLDGLYSRPFWLFHWRLGLFY